MSRSSNSSCTWRCVRVIGSSSLLMWLVISAAIPTSNSAAATSKGLEQWRSIKVGLRENKKSMCSFLLVQQSDKEVELSLDRVSDLFVQGLDHVGKSADYIRLMRPYIEKDMVSQFDLNGSKFVLEISDARRKLIADFEDAVANGANDERKGQILEKYFYKACEIKLGSVAAEKSMYATLLKMEKIVNKKLQADGAEPLADAV